MGANEPNLTHFSEQGFSCKSLANYDIRILQRQLFITPYGEFILQSK